MNPLKPKPDVDLKERRRSFASAKFDLLDWMSQDPRLTHLEFRVGVRLLQHANGETGAIFPSQQAIAEQIGVQARSVRSAIAGLKKKGWILTRRNGFNRPNSYAFDDRHANDILDRVATMADARREERETRALKTKRQDFAYHPPVTGKIPSLQSGMDLPLVTGRNLPPNTLKVTPAAEHLNREDGLEKETTKGRSRDAA